MRQASKRSRIRAGLLPADVAGAVASERISTLVPSTRVTGGIEDDLLARIHSEIRSHPFAEVARHSELADLNLAVVDHRVLQPIAVEDDRPIRCWVNTTREIRAE
jgi:hypothetical protein